MSVIFEITHTTHYRYAQPVTLGEHRVLFRPRDSHDLRVLATDLQVIPEPQGLRLIQDAYTNSVAVLQPQSPADELKVVAKFTVEHTGTRALDLPLDPAAEHYPFRYTDEERLALQHYLAPYYDDPSGLLAEWALQFVRPQATSENTDDGTDDGTEGAAAVGTRDVLVAMTRSIRDGMLYLPRFDEGVQTPYETLQRQSGTCRDFATLMIEAVRRLGYAARFVSGYLYTPWLDADEGERSGVGATHAWVQVYLPGAGWLPFDPTNNLIGGTDLVRVGVARHGSLVSPVSGSWVGFPGDYLGMDVDVVVRKKAA